MRAGAQLCLVKGTVEFTVKSHDLARRAHFGTKKRIYAREAREGQNGLFHREAFDAGWINQVKIAQGFPGHDSGSNGRNWAAHSFGHERYGAAGAWVDFDQVDIAILDGELHIHQSDNVQRQCQGFGLPFQLVNDVL